MMSKSLIILLVALVLGLNAQKNEEDQKCLSTLCPQNFRCQQGRCLRQQRKAKKSFCIKPEFYSNIQAIRCTNRDYTCSNIPESPTCGFSYDKTPKPFTNNCTPCLDENIDYYYKLKCEDAPTLCNQNEECLNGKCVAMFDKTIKDKNRKICNSNEDCKKIIELCVANKCVSKTTLISQLAKRKQ